MAWTKSQTEFHQTFPPQSEYVARILELAAAEYEGTVTDISERTGIPTGKQKGKVKPHIYYAKYMGLIDFSLQNGVYKLKLTDLGNVVYENDPYMLESKTGLLCHYNICDTDSGAPQWAYVFKQSGAVLDKSESAQFVQSRIDEQYGFNVSLSVVKSAYTGGMFEELELLEWTDRIVHVKKDMHYSDMSVYAYSLLDMWERYMGDRTEIIIDDITDGLKWNYVFGFDTDEALRVLEELEEGGIVKLNKQLRPISVIKTAARAELLGKLYD